MVLSWSWKNTLSPLLLISLFWLPLSCEKPPASGEKNPEEKLRVSEPELYRSLTGEERQWLADHREITLAVMNAWPPMNYVDEYGVPRGIGADYMEAVNKRLNLSVTLVPGTFADNLEGVRTGRYDALMDVTPKPDREEYLNFTEPYLNIPHVIVSRKGGPPFPADAGGDRLACGAGADYPGHRGELDPLRLPPGGR